MRSKTYDRDFKINAILIHKTEEKRKIQVFYLIPKIKLQIGN